MEPRVSLITLGVRDLARAIDFYETGLGWRRSSVGGDGVAFFQIGGTILSLYPREALAADAGISPDGSGFAGITLAHNVRERQQVDEIIALAVRAGGTVIKQAEEVFWGGYSGYFADPDGHLWEVAWNPGFPIAADGTIRLPD